MKKFLLVFAILVSIPCFATTEDEDELSKPMHYALVPSVGFHLAFTELSGKSSVATGPMGGLGFRFLRDGYFFIPNARLVSIIGLDKSPAAMWTIGFMAGGRLKWPNADVFLGVDSATIIDSKTNAAGIIKLGVIFDLGLSDFQLVLNGFYGSFQQDVYVGKILTKRNFFDYAGAEIAVQFPMQF